MRSRRIARRKMVFNYHPRGLSNNIFLIYLLGISFFFFLVRVKKVKIVFIIINLTIFDQNFIF